MGTIAFGCNSLWDLQIVNAAAFRAASKSIVAFGCCHLCVLLLMGAVTFECCQLAGL